MQVRLQKINCLSINPKLFTPRNPNRSNKIVSRILDVIRKPQSRDAFCEKNRELFYFICKGMSSGYPKKKRNTAWSRVDRVIGVFA